MDLLVDPVPNLFQPCKLAELLNFFKLNFLIYEMAMEMAPAS